MTNKEKVVVWFLPHITHYHNFLFNKIKQNIAIKLKVVYFQKVLKNYPWKTNWDIWYNVTYLKTGFIRIDWRKIFQLNSKNIYVIAGWSEPTTMIILTICCVLKFKYLILTDTPNPRKRSGIKSVFRQLWLNWIINNANRILVTGSMGCYYFIQKGIDENKVINFPFVVDLDLFIPPSINLNRSSKNVIFSSGRIDFKHKGYDNIFYVLAILKKSGYDFMYKIAGVGPDMEKAKELVNKLGLMNNVIFLNWVEPLDLVRYYQ
jgi:glycosyltransferase involved in cell wall biosynthesis